MPWPLKATTYFTDHQPASADTATTSHRCLADACIRQARTAAGHRHAATASLLRASCGLAATAAAVASSTSAPALAPTPAPSPPAAAPARPLPHSQRRQLLRWPAGQCLARLCGYAERCLWCTPSVATARWVRTRCRMCRRWQRCLLAWRQLPDGSEITVAQSVALGAPEETPFSLEATFDGGAREIRGRCSGVWTRPLDGWSVWPRPYWRSLALADPRKPRRGGPG